MKEQEIIEKINQAIDGLLDDPNRDPTHPTGCCVIHFQGSKIKRDGMTENECNALADMYHATAEFKWGPCF